MPVIGSSFKGSTEGISLIETIMEHIANVVKKDPIDVRLANMVKEGNPIPQMIVDIKKLADYDKRSKEIDLFNKVIKKLIEFFNMAVVDF